MKRKRKVEMEMDAIARWENEGGSCQECFQPKTRTLQPKQNSQPVETLKLMTRIVQAASHLQRPSHQ